ncbi:MAG: hypothetical protein MRY77_15505 [Rhodobacteraceae bacterium]|nr:hypothetical protein [Paracoccaceae bacterium]
MHITFSPMRMDDPIALLVNGDTLVVNEIGYDFSDIPDGATLPREAVDCPWLASDVERIDGEIRLTLILPHGPGAEEGDRHPQPVTVTAGAVGLVPLADPAAFNGAIDLTQLITAEDKTAEAEVALLASRKAECRARIFAVVDQTAQMNLAAAAAAGVLDAGSMAVYRSGLAWIHAMRAAQADGNWPAVPAGVAELAEQF